MWKYSCLLSAPFCFPFFLFSMPNTNLTSSISTSSPCSVTMDHFRIYNYHQNLGIPECFNFTKEDPHCASKCYFEKKGYFNDKREFQPEKLKEFLREFTNGTESFREAMAVEYQKCDKEADEQCLQWERMSIALEGCEKFGLFELCTRRKAEKNVFANITQLCSEYSTNDDIHK